MLARICGCDVWWTVREPRTTQPDLPFLSQIHDTDEVFFFFSRCTFTPEHGKAIGWRPQFHAEHILETADEEVQLILDNLPA